MEKPAGPNCLPDRTVFTTSSPLFQIGFFTLIHQEWNPDWVSTWTIVHLYLQEMLREDVQDMIEDSWVWKVDEHQQRLSRRRETQSKNNVFQMMKAHSEGHFHLCRRNLGSFKWDSHHWTQDSLSRLYTLSILSFVGLCKHKEVLKQFLDAQLYTLLRSYLRDDQVKVHFTARWQSEPNISNWSC